MTYHIHDLVFHSCIQRLFLDFCFLTFSRPFGKESPGLGKADGVVDEDFWGWGFAIHTVSFPASSPRCRTGSRGKSSEDRTEESLPRGLLLLLSYLRLQRKLKGPGELLALACEESWWKIPGWGARPKQTGSTGSGVPQAETSLCFSSSQSLLATWAQTPASTHIQPAVSSRGSYSCLLNQGGCQALPFAFLALTLFCCPLLIPHFLPPDFFPGCCIPTTCAGNLSSWRKLVSGTGPCSGQTSQVEHHRK